MLARISPARLGRLCMKELRESLRDRRTIVTLVLMPLLVYPLLSLVLNRALLTGFSQSDREIIRFGVSKELQTSGLPSMLTIGYALLHEPQFAPLFLEPPVADRLLKKSSSLEPPPTALPLPELLLLEGDGRKPLRHAVVDLVIVRKARAEGEFEEPAPASNDELSLNLNDTSASNLADETPDQSTVELDRFGDSSPNASTNEQSPSRDGSADESRLAPPVIVNIQDQLEELEGTSPSEFLNAMGTYEIRYRHGDPVSERAVQLLERIVAAVNNQVTRGVSQGASESIPFQLRATPVSMKSGYADVLSTMVPLVLVLMTMAGAVYPAIDLTAGERERGTMESLIVTPTPTAIILFAKYTAVVTVALLTALANLGAMTLTLWVSGIGEIIFGSTTLSAATVGTVLLLLVLFTMFFASLLLAITSFAKSFKEAQAYLIPLMLLALTPGVLSLLPGIQFTTLLATVPLVNIVLLAREVLIGEGQWNTGLVAVICNVIYALASLSVASRLFGSDASMQGSKGSWRDLMMRPETQRQRPTVDQMALTMAIMFPLYFIASSSLSGGGAQALEASLWASAAVSYALILGAPLVACWYRRITLRSALNLKVPGVRRWCWWTPSLLVLATTSWILAHEIFLFGQWLGIGTISLDQFSEVAAFQDRLKSVPLWVIWLTLAVTPAICEEVLFRGFVLSSLRKYSTSWAIVITALLFGLMHVLTSNVLAIERFLPTTFIGLILGVIAVRTGSIWPGMCVHAIHNALLLSMGYFEERITQWNILVEESEHLPLSWIIFSGLLVTGALAVLCVQTRRRPDRSDVGERSEASSDQSSTPACDATTSEEPVGGLH